MKKRKKFQRVKGEDKKDEEKRKNRLCGWHSRREEMKIKTVKKSKYTSLQVVPCLMDLPFGTRALKVCLKRPKPWHKSF